MLDSKNSEYQSLKWSLLSLLLILSISFAIASPPPPSQNGGLPPGGRPPLCALNPVPNITGSWKMVADNQYQFNLAVKQSGRDFTGTMTRTNGQEPVDSVSGSVSSCTGIEFTRERQGSFVQQYSGNFSGSGEDFNLEGNFTYNGTGQYPWSARKSKEAPLSQGWDIFSEPLSSGKVQWIALDNGKLEAIFELNGASPNHRYIAGAHFFDPEGSTQLPAVCQFGGTKITCNREYQTREGATAKIIGSWDFGYLDTDGNGYGKAQFTLLPPAGTYFTQFTVRIGDQCNPANGSTSGCAVVYRTGTKMGQGFEKIIIPSAQLQNPLIPVLISGKIGTASQKVEGRKSKK
jgi:hypothetical protein